MLTIRKESPQDYQEIYTLVQNAFKTAEMSSGKEQDIVESIRLSDNYIPELSLVGCYENQIICHIMISKCNIISNATSYDSLVVAPLSVHPTYQKPIKEATQLGFGYVPSTKFGITSPIPVDEKNCMVLALDTKVLEGIKGVINFPSYFNE
ncbi:N-acetyltransferase domain-containing protein [Entamoeba marina]